MNDDKGIGPESATDLTQLRLADFIDFLPNATMMINRRGEVVFWNRAMETLTGVPASEMIGNADIALYKAKNGGGDASRRYFWGNISENISQ